jgi:mono/diheme cytochrome c family protein
MRLELLVLPLAMVACDGRWPADMVVQPALGPLEIARAAPPGSVPVGAEPEVEDREDAQDFTNPRKDDPAAVAQGQKLFANYCVQCHGDDGHGNGPLADQMPPAPDLRHVSICRRTDGFIYGTLTAGGRAMPPMREGLSPAERWALVDYVRKIQSEGCTGSDAGMDAQGGGE